MGLMIKFAFPFAFAAIGYRTYMVNGAFNVLAPIFVIFTCVETKGKSLEEIDVLMDGEEHAHLPDVHNVMAEKAFDYPGAL